MSLYRVLLTLIGYVALGGTLPAHADEPRKDLLGDPLPAGALARLGTERLCHPHLERLAFSPDGKFLVSGGSGELRFWEVASGREIRRIDATRPDWSAPQWTALAYSPDGKVLAAGCFYNHGDQSLGLWDATNGEALHTFEKFWPASLCFSPDGHSVAAGNFEGNVCIWDPGTGRKTGEHKVATSAHYLAYSGDSKKLVIAGYRKGRSHNLYFRLLDVATGEELESHEAEIASQHVFQLSPGGRLCAGASMDSGAINLWDPATGKKIRGIRGTTKHWYRMSFSADSRLLAARGDEGLIQVWDTATGKVLHRLKAPSPQDNQIILSPDGKTLASSCSDNHAISLWDVAKAKPMHTFSGHRGGQLHVAFSSDSKTVLTAGVEGGHAAAYRVWPYLTVRHWEAASGKELRTSPLLSGANDYSHQLCVAFSPDGKLLACPDFDGTLRLLEVATTREVRRWKLPTRQVQIQKDGKKQAMQVFDVGELRFSRDGKTLVSIGNGRFYFWEVPTGKELHHFERQSGHRGLLAPDGRSIFVLDANGRILQLEASSGKLIRQLGETRSHYPFALSADERTLLVPDGKAVRLVEIASGQDRAKLVDGQSWPRALMVSPDGRLLASASGTKVRLWHLATGKLLCRFSGHRMPPESLAFSPDGKMLATGTYDNTAYVWDVAAALAAERRVAVKLTPKELDDLWAEMASDDAAKAYRAVGKMEDAPESSVAFLKKHLQVAKPNAQRLAKLVAELDDDAFAVREKATLELEAMGDEAEGVVRKALQNKPSVEARRRLERILAKLGPDPAPARLRLWRAVEVLENCATDEARQVLKDLAKGAPEARLTQEAKASLERLDRAATNKSKP
jgi:WD40 repeat protein